MGLLDVSVGLLLLFVSFRPTGLVDLLLIGVSQCEFPVTSSFGSICISSPVVSDILIIE